VSQQTPPVPTIFEDEDARLASLGYKPQLNRVLGFFAHFSVAFEDTNRARASRSTVSARPKLWVTFATGLPVPDAARCARAAGRTPPNRPGSPAASPAGTCLHKIMTSCAVSSDTPQVVCLHDFADHRPPQAPDQAKRPPETLNMPTSYPSPAGGLRALPRRPCRRRR